MMLRATSIARASAVKIELSIGRAFLRIVLFKTATHSFIVVLGAIRKDIEGVRVVLENIVKFLLISAGVGFSFGMFIQFKNHFGSFNDPGWRLWKSAFMYVI